jgi:hypothetical protein
MLPTYSSEKIMAKHKIKYSEDMIKLWGRLVEALRYKLEGRGFDSRWCHWNSSLT